MVQVETIPPLVVVAPSEVEPVQLDPQRPTVVSETQKQQQQQRQMAQVARQQQQGAQSKEAESSVQPAVDFSRIAEELQQVLAQDRMVQFMIDKATKKIVLRIIDTETQDIIVQLPPEQSLKIAQYILGKVREGLVTDARV